MSEYKSESNRNRFAALRGGGATPTDAAPATRSVDAAGSTPGASLSRSEHAPSKRNTHAPQSRRSAPGAAQPRRRRRRRQHEEEEEPSQDRFVAVLAWLLPDPNDPLPAQAGVARASGPSGSRSGGGVGGGHVPLRPGGDRAHAHAHAQAMLRLQAVRREWDDAYDRWRPHVTLVAPFHVPFPGGGGHQSALSSPAAADAAADPFAQAKARLEALAVRWEAICASTPPCEVTLDDVGTFPLRGYWNVHLRPGARGAGPDEDANANGRAALCALQARLQAAFLEGRGEAEGIATAEGMSRDVGARGEKGRQTFTGGTTRPAAGGTATATATATTQQVGTDKDDGQRKNDGEPEPEGKGKGKARRPRTRPFAPHVSLGQAENREEVLRLRALGEGIVGGGGVRPMIGDGDGEGDGDGNGVGEGMRGGAGGGGGGDGGGGHTSTAGDVDVDADQVQVQVQVQQREAREGTLTGRGAETERATTTGGPPRPGLGLRLEMSRIALLAKPQSEGGPYMIWRYFDLKG